MSDKTFPPDHVTVGGRLYVPAVTVSAGLNEFLRALARQYTTDEYLDEHGFTDGGPLRVVVTDAGPLEGGETFDELAARLAKELGR